MADETTDTPDTTTSTKAAPPIDDKKVAKQLKEQLEARKTKRKEMIPAWKRNVETRRGFPEGAGSTVGVGDSGGDLQSEINPDWSLTKTKTANLYSQDPQVQGTHENKKYAAAVPPFMKALNYELGEKRAKVGVAMFEVLNDCVNAAGIGGVIVSYAARFETVPMPQEEFISDPTTGQRFETARMTPEQLQMAVQGGIVHMTDQQRPVSYKFCIDRISPGDLLFPPKFKRSDFDTADWTGYSGQMAWADALNEDWGLKPEDKEEVCGQTASREDLSGESRTMDVLGNTERVDYDELYYWRHKFDPEEKHFNCIWKVVFVKGKTDAVYHKQWTGQKLVDVAGTTKKQYVGAIKFPVRFLTLTYISDVAVPPSDTAAGRPQVDDLRRSRSQLFQNRRSSLPMRWVDHTRMDPLVLQNLMRGTWQGFIPTLGDGNRAIGEVARASYPAEDLAFDRETKQDLMETWRIGPNQNGNFQGGRQTAAESQIAQSNFSTDIGQERGRTSAFFLGIVEVLAGLMALYSDFPTLTDEERMGMEQAWDSRHILHDLVFKIRPDATIMLDTESLIQRTMRLINMTVKSGFVNPKPLITRMVELSGEDPSEVIIDPQPAEKDEKNVSYRFTGKEDMMNTMVLAVMLNEGKAPEPEHIEKAKQLQMLALQPPQPPQVPGAGPQEGQPPVPGAPGPPPPGPAGNPGPPPNPQIPEGAHSNWNLASTVAKRQRDIGGA